MDKLSQSLIFKKRLLSEKIFHSFLIAMIGMTLLFLVVLLGKLLYDGSRAFYHYTITLPISVDVSLTDIKDPYHFTDDALQQVSFTPLLQTSLEDILPFPLQKQEKKSLYTLLSPESLFSFRDHILENPHLIGQTISQTFEVSGNIEHYLKYERGSLLHKTIQEPLKVALDHKDFSFRKSVRIFSTQNVMHNHISADACHFSEEKSTCSFSAEKPSYFIRVGNLYGKLQKIFFLEGKKELLFVKIYTRPKQDHISDSTNWTLTKMPTPETKRKISDMSMILAEDFLSKGIIRSRFPNIPFLTSADSRNPEQAGILGALVGSLMTISICLIIALPIGVCAAVYLEEFTLKSRLSSFFEVNINNLAAVPSIIYGLLGLSLLLNYFNLPRSSPFVGGIVLGVMSLPIIIIATRASLRSVPQTIRDAAMGLGATKVQTFFHHVLPMSLPGILTGSILALSRSIGETAPLLLIGMMAFISDIPTHILDTATILPVQIFLWSENPEIPYRERTSAAIVILLLFMICLNLIVALIRHKFERKY